MSNSTGSSPTTSRSVPHSSHETISPLSVSRSTWTSASHSGQVPVGTVSSSPAMVKAGIPPSRESTLPCKQPNQSTRERWNLQHSFSWNVGPIKVIFLCRKYPSLDGSLLYSFVPNHICSYGAKTEPTRGPKPDLTLLLIAYSQIGTRRIHAFTARLAPSDNPKLWLDHRST